MIIAVFSLLISKSPIFNDRDTLRPSTIPPDDEKINTYAKTSFPIKKNKVASLAKTKDINEIHTSKISKKASARETDKTTEELIKDFSSMENDGKINLIINLESLAPDLLTLAFSDKSADVRLAAAKCLYWLETDQKNILPFIMLAMNDGAIQIRDESFSLMDSLNYKGDILSLTESAMNSEFTDVRLKAVSKFIDTDIPREDVKPLLLKALSDKDGTIRAQALLSAAFLWNQEFISEDDAIKYLSKH